MKKLIRLILGLVVLYFLVKLCTSNIGSVIQLPGGTESAGTEDSGGWLTPKNNGSGGDKTLKDISEDLERTLGIGKKKERGTVTEDIVPSTSSEGSLTFKGIPITGSLSSFGRELGRAGFQDAGNGSYTGEFAGYRGCRVTPVGNNPVREVRVDFPVISDWNTLEKAYDDLQADLTRKYGVEPKTSKDSNLAVYELPAGTIYLDADVKEQSSWHVILKYSNVVVGSVPASSGRNPIDDL